jgi:hypothetical protein
MENIEEIISSLQEELSVIDYDKIIHEFIRGDSVLFKMIFYIEESKVIIMIDRRLESKKYCILSIIVDNRTILVQADEWDNIIENTKKVRSIDKD